MIPHGLLVAPDVQLVVRRRRQCELGGRTVHSLKHRDYRHGEASIPCIEKAAKEKENIGRVVQHLLPRRPLLLAQTVDKHEGEKRKAGQLMQCILQQCWRAVVQRRVKRELQRRDQGRRVQLVECMEELCSAIASVEKKALKKR